MPENNMEFRSYPVEIRVSDEENRRIVGHAAVFNSRSQLIAGLFQETILPGAFRDVLNDDVRALINHNPNYILGRTKSGTLRLSEDSTGLAVDITPPDTTYARDLLTSMNRGDIDQMSFSFKVGKDRWYEEDGVVVREIIKIDKVYDVSPVTYPAYTETDVSARSLEAYENYRANQGNAGGADGSPDADSNGDAGAEARTRRLTLLEKEIIEVK